MGEFDRADRDVRRAHGDDARRVSRGVSDVDAVWRYGKHSLKSSSVRSFWGFADGISGSGKLSGTTTPVGSHQNAFIARMNAYWMSKGVGPTAPARTGRRILFKPPSMVHRLQTQPLALGTFSTSQRSEWISEGR